MVILILELIALFLLIVAAISIGWISFINRALNSKTLARKWQMSAVEKVDELTWGQVYESYTYKPIAGAVVRLYDAVTKERLDYTTTDKDGKFGFSVPDGKFYLRVNSFYHSFPSQKMIIKYKPALSRRRDLNNEYFGLFLPEIHDKGYENIYFGEIINNRSRAMQRIFASRAEMLESIEAKTPILLNIPMDKDEILTLDEITLESITKQESAFRRLKVISLIFGLGAIIASFIIKPNYLNLAILEVFLPFVLWGIYDKMRTKFSGRITDESDKPLGYALIRARGYKTKNIRSTAISDGNGHFDIPLYPGWYTFEASKDNYLSEKRLIKCEKKEEVKADFKLKRILP